MFKIIREKLKENKIIKEGEYARVHANFLTKFLVQASITIINICIMIMLIWALFHYIIPQGSWINIVDGNSMDPTMKNGQITFTSLSPIKRGDIITSFFPKNSPKKYKNQEDLVIVKRIIGVPGDKVVIDRDGVYVNDMLMEEPYLTKEAKAATFRGNEKNSIILKENQFFIMGDGREVSFDSREFGPITSNDILYKQSTKPTKNFYTKLVFVVAMFILDLLLYSLIEFVLTEIVYYFLNKKDQKQKKQISTSRS